MLNLDYEAILRQVRDNADRIGEMMRAAADRQWEPAPIPKPRTDTTERAQGERPADPVADAVLDPRRLAVREALLDTQRAIRDLDRAMKSLESAIRRWDGEEA